MSASRYEVRQLVHRPASRGEAYVIAPPVLKSTFGSISLPAASTCLVMLNAARVFEMFKKRESSARCAPFFPFMISFEKMTNRMPEILPGHARRPNPKTNFKGLGWGVGPRWRAGSKTKGAGYMWLSCRIALVETRSIWETLNLRMSRTRCWQLQLRLLEWDTPHTCHLQWLDVVNLRTEKSVKKLRIDSTTILPDLKEQRDPNGEPLWRQQLRIPRIHGHRVLGVGLGLRWRRSQIERVSGPRDVPTWGRRRKSSQRQSVRETIHIICY